MGPVGLKGYSGMPGDQGLRGPPGVPGMDGLPGLSVSQYDCVFFLYLHLLISTRSLPSRYTTGYLQRCLQWVDYRDVYSLSHFTTYPLSTGQYLVSTLGVLMNLISLGIFLKCLEDTSEVMLTVFMWYCRNCGTVAVFHCCSGRIL